MRTMIAVIAMLPLAACATTGQSNQVSSRTAEPAAKTSADSMQRVSGAPAVASIPGRNDRVRVVFPATAAQPQRFAVGHLQRLSSDTVILARGLVLDTIALAGGRQLQVVVRSRGHAWNGAGIGGLSGAVLGGVVGAVTWRPCTDTGFLACLMYPSRGEQIGGGALLGGILGALVGAAIGSGSRTEEWGTVPLGGARVSVTPSGLGVSMAF